jgi:Holliday junction resolvasome RuvABC ATP-dependent DNA helicase subunit
VFEQKTTRKERKKERKSREEDDLTEYMYQESARKSLRVCVEGSMKRYACMEKRKRKEKKN